MQWSDVLDPTRGELTPGSVMPADGASISGASTGSNVRRGITQSGMGAASAAPMPAGNLVIGMLVFAVLVFVTMFVVHKWGGESDDFSNIRASAYNVLIISLIAAIGIPVIKIGFWKLADMGVPLADHAATWVLAA